MPTQPGASVTSDEYVGGGYKNSEPNWDVFFSLYQTPDYRPRTGQTNVMAMPGTIGILKMGDSTANTIRINVTTGSVLFKLNEPTCLIYSINNSNMRDHYDVNFGDFFVSDFDKTSGYTAERRFTLDLYNCSMNGVSITVNGVHTADGNTLISKAAQQRALVSISPHSLSIAGKPSKLMAVRQLAQISVGMTVGINYYQIPFSGKLKKIGEIKAGSFSSTATFTISYN
jgi:type 1 fimbria pilin